jgi:membrane-associated protease RseP (regulator of RpoE activity)
MTMLLKSANSVERRCPHHRAFFTGAGLLLLAVLGSGVGRQVAAAVAPDPESNRKDDSKKKDDPQKDESPSPEPKKDARKSLNPAAPKLPMLPAGLSLEDLLRSSGLSDERVRTFTGQLPDDNTLKELIQERERVLQGLQGLFGNPDSMPVWPAFPANRAFQGIIGGRQGEGRLGVGVSKPGPTLTEQLDLPKGQGLTLEAVQPDSAAARAGLKPHDILLELDGKAVPNNPGEFAKQLAALPSGKAIEALVLRRGKRETLKGLKLPDVKEPVTRPGFGFDAFKGIPEMGRGPGALGAGPPGFQGFGFSANMPTPRGGVITTTWRSDDRFTSRHEEGSLIITLTGKVEKGKAKVGEIQVQDGRESHKYETLEKVPEAYRDKAKHLADLVEKDNVQISIEGYDGAKPLK